MGSSTSWSSRRSTARLADLQALQSRFHDFHRSGKQCVLPTAAASPVVVDTRELDKRTSVSNAIRHGYSPPFTVTLTAAIVRGRPSLWEDSRQLWPWSLEKRLRTAAKHASREFWMGWPGKCRMNAYDLRAKKNNFQGLLGAEGKVVFRPFVHRSGSNNFMSKPKASDSMSM